MKEDTIVGLDIGSTAIRIVVGQNNSNGQLQIIGAVENPVEGISRGVVKSIEDVTSSISACLEKAERLVGIPIDAVWVGINSAHIKCEKSRGVVAIGRSDGEINQDDVERALEAARALSVPPNYEILHVIPTTYKVDNQEDIKDPIGMTGVRLEVETLIIQGLSGQIKNLTKAIFRTRLDIEDLVLSPLAAAETVIESKQKELGSVLVNIGASTTSLAIYEEGELLHTAVIPIGSEHITADIAIGLRCPIDLAEDIKVKYGDAVSSRYTEDEKYDISDLLNGSNEEMREVSKKYLAEIIEARVEEIFMKVDDELKKVERSGMLPGGVFLVGGGSRLVGIVDVVKRQLRLPVCLGKIKNISIIIDKVAETEYLNALGLVIWGSQVYDNSGGSGYKIPGKDVFLNISQKIKTIFSSLMSKK